MTSAAPAKRRGRPKKQAAPPPAPAPPQSNPNRQVLPDGSVALRGDELMKFICEDFQNFLLACAQIDGFSEVPWFHKMMADFLQGRYPEWVARKKKIMGFRLAAKSTVAVRRYIEWRWLRQKRMQVIVHSATDEFATKLARGIRNDLETNPLLQHLCPNKNEGEIEFNIAGVRPEVGHSIETAGVKTSKTGSRADLYIFDDPEPDVDPEAMRKRVIAAMVEAGHILQPPNRLFRRQDVPVPERTQLVVVGQPHCENSAYYESEDDVANEEGHPLADAIELVIPAVSPNGKWTWPQLMNSKYFNWEEGRPMTVPEVMRTMPSTTWHLQMQIDRRPLSSYGAVVKLHHVKRHLIIPKRATMVVDPADSAERGCETGVTIGFADGPNSIHLCWMGGFRGETYEGDDEETLGESIWRHIFDIAEEFNVDEVLLEKNYKAARLACRRYLSKTGRFANVVEFTARANKLRRICEALEQPFANGFVSVNPEVLASRENVRQLTRLRFDELPSPCDRIDSAAALISYLIESQSQLQGQRKSIHIPPNIRPASFQT